MSTIILSTKRLIIREISLSDVPFILELLNTPNYLQFIGDKNVHNLVDAETHIKERLDAYVKKENVASIGF